MVDVVHNAGVYVPPHMRKRLAEQQAKENKNVLSKDEDEQFQRQKWTKMRKKINNLINKINIKNLPEILPEVFDVNLVRGRGIFCKTLMKAQLAAPTMYTKIYACLVAVINTKLPENGRLLVIRLVAQFRRGMKLNDKSRSISSAIFLAHLINQRVVHEILGLQLVQLLLENPTDASVEVAIEFTKQVGALLDEIVPKGLHFIFETFRNLLQRDSLSKRVMYQIEQLFIVRRNKFEAYPSVPKELDLVELEDQITHDIALDEPDLGAQKMDELNYFKLDNNFIQGEQMWKTIKAEILDDDEEEDSGTSGSSSSGESVEDSDSEDEEEPSVNNNLTAIDAQLIASVNNNAAENKGKDEVTDLTESDLVSLRRVIYLTIMSSMNFEECCHKILKMQIPVGLEMEVVLMLIDCCSQEKVFEKFFGSLAVRLCQLSQVYNHCFVVAFKEKFETCHRLETNPLRNISKLYAFILTANAIRWELVLSCIRITERDTTSSSRIFIKTLLQDISENLGIQKLKERLLNPETEIYSSGVEEWEAMQSATVGLFPKDSLENARFSVNFFVQIGLGALTDDMRQFLQNPPKEILEQNLAANDYEGSDSDSSSDATSGSSSDSDSNSGSSSGEESVTSTESRISKRKVRRSISKSSSRQRPTESERGAKMDRSKQERSTGLAPRPPSELPPALQQKMKLIEKRQEFLEIKSPVPQSSKKKHSSVKSNRSSSSRNKRRSSRRTEIRLEKRNQSHSSKRLQRRMRPNSRSASQQHKRTKRRRSRSSSRGSDRMESFAQRRRRRDSRRSRTPSRHRHRR